MKDFLAFEDLAFEGLGGTTTSAAVLVLEGWTFSGGGGCSVAFLGRAQISIASFIGSFSANLSEKNVVTKAYFTHCIIQWW